jgi:dephospho-CoA kinase
VPLWQWQAAILDGYRVFDADILARQAVEAGSPTLAAVVDLCGSEVLAADGSLARKKLGVLLFADAVLRNKVETLIHGRIWQLLAQEVADLQRKESERFWFFSAALLCETGNYQRFAQLWVTSCPEALQRQRLIARDQVSAAFAEQVIGSQLPLAEKRRLADVVIDTDRPMAAVQAQVLGLLRQLA